MLTKTEPAGTTTYAYDVFGNLLSVDLPDTTAIDYVVDAKNRRIGRKVNGTLTQGMLWQSQLAPIAELDGSGTVVSRFVHATRINVPDYMVKGGSTYRLLTDHLGSPRLVIDTTTGAVAQRIDYDEWGVVLQDTNPGWMPFGFAGGGRDGLTALSRFGQRDYHAMAGRWTGRDPILFQSGSTELHGYVDGDPVNRRDPSGLQGAPVSPFTPLKPQVTPAMVAWCEAMSGADAAQDQLRDPYDDLACDEGEAPRDLFPGDSARLPFTREDCEKLGYFAGDQLPTDKPEDGNFVKRTFDKVLNFFTWLVNKVGGN